MQLNSPQLLNKVSEFSVRHSIAGQFVIGAIESAAILKKKKFNYQDPVTVLRRRILQFQ